MFDKKVLVIIGTRPEAIKMDPLIKVLHARPNGAAQTVLCVIAQQLVFCPICFRSR